MTKREILYHYGGRVYGNLFFINKKTGVAFKKFKKNIKSKFCFHYLPHQIFSKPLFVESVIGIDPYGRKKTW